MNRNSSNELNSLYDTPNEWFVFCRLVVSHSPGISLFRGLRVGAAVDVYNAHLLRFDGVIRFLFFADFFCLPFCLPTPLKQIHTALVGLS